MFPLSFDEQLLRKLTETVALSDLLSPRTYRVSLDAVLFCLYESEFALLHSLDRRVKILLNGLAPGSFRLQKTQ